MKRILINYAGDRSYISNTVPTHRGGQADIFQAWDANHESDIPTYAVKMARYTESDSNWIARECEELQRLHKKYPDAAEHLVTIVDQGEHQGRRFLVMPWYPQTLTRWSIGQPLERLLDILTRLADSVVHLQIDEVTGAYRRDVVHRDIKPDNVFVIDNGGETKVLLGDFGAVKSRHLFTSGFNTGYHTEGYSPIDQLLPQEIPPNPTWDTYALGCTVFRVLSGLPPQGVTRSYTQLTDKGRRLQRHSQTYRINPSGQLYREILALSREALPELVQLNTINPLLKEDVRDLRQSLHRLLAGRLRGAEAFARELTRKLEEILRGVLAPWPRARPESARDLRDRLSSLHEMVARALRGERRTAWPRMVGGGVAVAITALTASAVMPNSTELSVTAANVPPWSSVSAVLTQHTSGARVALSGRNKEILAFSSVPSGEWVLELTGATPDGRCRWRQTQALDIRAGLLPQREQLTIQNQDCPTAEHSYPLITLPPGQFQVGRHPDEPGYDEDEPLQQPATVYTPLQVGALEVNQALWAAVMVDDPVTTHRVGPPDATGARCDNYFGVSLAGDTLPALCVSWCEALEFSNRLSRLERLRPAYKGVEQCAEGGTVTWDRTADGYRLPTEVEWEYAARSGQKHPLYAGLWFQPGDDEVERRASRRLCTYANVADQHFDQGRGEAAVACDDGFVGVAPVGSFEPNDSQLYDMTGNVSEWVWDRYEHDTDRMQVVRGGSFDSYLYTARIANRGAVQRDGRSVLVGLRVVRTPQEAP